MTTGIIFGCFDLFHIGHLNALLEASNNCNELYIGVFSNTAIEKYKGEPPVIDEADRLLIINRLVLDCPSHVFLVAKRGPTFIGQDILFIDKVIKRSGMLDTDFKGEIIYVPRTMRISTTLIIKECKKR